MRVQAKALALLLLAACAEPDEGSPTEAATAYLKTTLGEGGWSLSSVVPAPETKSENEVVAIVTAIVGGQEVSGPFSFTRASGRWEVRHDLNKLLKETVVDSATARHSMAERCAKRLSERYGEMLDITASLKVEPYDTEIEIRGSDVLATVRSNFVYKTIPSKPTGLYVDTYAYQDGEWRLQGSGSLFDGPPSR